MDFIFFFACVRPLQVAGLPLFVAKNEDEIESLKQTVDKMLDEVLATIHTEDSGVHVQVSI